MSKLLSIVLLVVSFCSDVLASEQRNLEIFEGMQRELLLNAGFAAKDVHDWNWERNMKTEGTIVRILDNNDNQETDLLLIEQSELCNVKKKFDQDFEKDSSGKFYLPAVSASSVLQELLKKHKNGIKVEFADQQTVVVRYSLFKNYILYSIQNKVKSFEPITAEFKKILDEKKLEEKAKLQAAFCPITMEKAT